MDVFTVTSLDATTVEVESYSTETGAYSQLPAKHPAFSERLIPGGVAGGYFIGCTTIVPPDLEEEIVDQVFAGKLEAPPPAASSIDLAASELRIRNSQNLSVGGAVYLYGAVLIIGVNAGSVTYALCNYGTWPDLVLLSSDQNMVIEFQDGSLRMAQVDADASEIRISTVLGVGDVDVAMTAPLSDPPEGTFGDAAREYGALALAKAMDMAKTYGTPLRICGSLSLENSFSFPPSAINITNQSVTCPDENDVYTVARYTMALESAAYQAEAGYTSFTAGDITTYPDPTSGSIDFYWLVPSPPVLPTGFWTQFKKCEEQI